MSHSTVPNNSDALNFKIAKKIIKTFLFKMFGKENAKTAKTIARRLGLKIKDPTAQPVRAAAKDILKGRYGLERLPMLSCRKGFFLATCRDEVKEYAKNLYNRKMAIEMDIRALAPFLKSSFWNGS